MARNYKEGDAPVPGYKLLKFLGRGGFGEVWKATAPGGFEVALKIINLSGKPGQKELRALQVVKRLRHPHLIQVTAFWLRDEEGNVLPDPEEALMGESTLSKAPEPTIQDTMIAPLDVMTDAVRTRPTELVIAMGLADQSLFDRLQECQRQGLPGIPTEELLGYMEDSARAIDYLNSPTHSFMGSEPMAVQHCDIKPHNILIVSGAAQVCDFGLARVMGDVQNSSAAAGTIAYAAPECIKEGKPSSTTDQYSLALSYLELKTGALPYDSETWMEVLTAVQQGNLNLTKLPQAEQVVVRRATAQNPADRFPSTTAMVHALREAALGLGPSVRQTESQPTGPTEGSESAEGLPLGILAAGLALVLALTGGGWYFWPRETTIPKKLVKGNDKKGDEDIKKKTEVPVAKTQKALGDEARGFEKFPEAIDHYTASLKEFPDDAVVHFSRGLCYLRTGRPDLAVADFEKAVELDQTDVERFRERPQFTEAYLDRGESLSEKSPAKAIEDFDRVLKANARHPAGLFGRAGALLRTKDYDGSIRDFKAAATADAKYAKSPELVAAYVARGETKLRTDPKSAEADASEALKIDDKSANAYLLRGTAKLEQGLLEESLPDFTRAIELNENDPRGRSRRGLVYLLLENYKEAIIDLSYAIKADEANPHPTDLLNRGKAYLLNGSYDHAIGDFDRLLAKDPNHAMGYYLRGDAHRNNNAPKKALEDYDKALKIDPKFAEAYFGRGIVYHGQMKYPEAVTNYTQAVKHGFYQGQAFDLRADVYEGNGQMAEAKNDRAAHALSKKIEADPKDSKSRAELAFMLATSPFADFRAGGWARELAQEACELTNEMDAASLDALAAAYAESGDFAEAVKWATKAQELATDADLKKAYAERAKKYEDKQPFRSPAPAS